MSIIERPDFDYSRMGESDIPGVSIHARFRFRDHFGRDPAREAWLAAVWAIMDGKALLLRRNARPTLSENTPRETYRVMLHGIEADLVWAPAIGMVVTAGPPGMLTKCDNRHNRASERGEGIPDWKIRKMLGATIGKRHKPRANRRANRNNPRQGYSTA